MTKRGNVSLGHVKVAGAGTEADPYVDKVALTEHYAPVGAHVSGANIAAATALVKPAGASQILIQALTQNVRFTLDGSDPTAAVGFQLLAGSAPVIISVPGVSIKVIQEAAAASLQYQWLA
jgi:hypothetical protein